MNEHRIRGDDTFLGQLRKNWQILAALVSVVIVASKMAAKVDNHENRIARVEQILTHMDGKVDRLVEELIDKRR